MEEATFFDRTTTLCPMRRKTMTNPVTVAIIWGGCSQMRNIVWIWVLGSDLGHTSIRGLASFGQRIITRIKVLSLLRSEFLVRSSIISPCLWRTCGLTLSLFWSRSFLSGSLPYKRKSLCSSGPRDYTNEVSVPGSAVDEGSLHNCMTYTYVDFVPLMRIHIELQEDGNARSRMRNK